MLCLSRKLGERIRLRCPDGTVIWLTLVEVDRNKVRLGFECPAGVEVLRQEIIGKMSFFPREPTPTQATEPNEVPPCPGP
jgi:carbon storage regulator CsrA